MSVDASEEGRLITEERAFMGEETSHDPFHGIPDFARRDQRNERENIVLGLQHAEEVEINHGLGAKTPMPFSFLLIQGDGSFMITQTP